MNREFVNKLLFFTLSYLHSRDEALFGAGVNDSEAEKYEESRYQATVETSDTFKAAYRTEKDSLGEVKVPACRLYGAQTARSLNNFKIGDELMPVELLRSLIVIKSAAAQVNAAKVYIDGDIARAIGRATHLLINNYECFKEEFPLHVWQTGSGTQSNMNVNEVIANLATLCLNMPAISDTEILSKIGTSEISALLSQAPIKVHPNDHVNCSQSSNDTFPSAMYLAAYLESLKVLQALERLSGAFTPLIERYKYTVKCGRTHLQDAVAITFGQEVGAWQALINEGKKALFLQLDSLAEVALGGTACGTGLNAPENFNYEVCQLIPGILREAGILSAEDALHYELRPAADLFAALSGKTAVSNVHGALAVIAGNLFKIADDIRYLASGPRCGYGEIQIPANEPGSSIMPGKVNPTQCEALTMVALQVMGNHQAVMTANSQGQFQLNTYMPLIIYNFLQSAKLLQEAVDSFRVHLLEGMSANVAKMQANFSSSLMNITALSPKLGYNTAAAAAKRALEGDLNLEEVVVGQALLSKEEFDELLDPVKLTYPHTAR